MDSLLPLKDWNEAHIAGLNARELADRAWAGWNGNIPVLPKTIAPPSVLDYRPEQLQPVSATNIDDFLSRKFPPRETMLSPWLPEQGLALLHAPRGVGKTHVAHGVGVAVAAASNFLRWQAARPRRVLLIDGEIPAPAVQQRLNCALRANGVDIADPTFFRIAAADSLLFGLPDLADPTNHQLFADVVADADFVILDNLSTICPGLKENDADSWTPVQAWALSLRRAGKSVLFIHHDGKSGAQRGTSRKEDVLDSVIGLRRPPDYDPSQGARFEVHFEKSRGFYGPDAEAFEARLVGEQWQGERRSGSYLSGMSVMPSFLAVRSR